MTKDLNAVHNQVVAPALPRVLTEPRPALIAGTLLFAFSFLVRIVVEPSISDSATLVCLAGVGVGVFGATVLTLQRRSALRGDRSAQQGLT